MKSGQRAESVDLQTFLSRSNGIGRNNLIGSWPHGKPDRILRRADHRFRYDGHDRLRLQQTRHRSFHRSFRGPAYHLLRDFRSATLWVWNESSSYLRFRAAQRHLDRPLDLLHSGPARQSCSVVRCLSSIRRGWSLGVSKQVQEHRGEP
jgi:hypothetical protein